MAGPCECGNGPLSSIQCEEFLTASEPVNFLERTLPYGAMDSG